MERTCTLQGMPATIDEIANICETLTTLIWKEADAGNDTATLEKIRAYFDNILGTMLDADQ